MSAGSLREALVAVLDGLLREAPAREEAEVGYALPEASLELLTKLVKAAGIKRVFEFGSGRSTRAFLAAGCDVTALENSREWMEQTLAAVPPEQRARLHGVCQPLRVVYSKGVPFRSWVLDDETRGRLAAAELILIDSPAYPPFREHALELAVKHAPEALIVMDDAGIPTVRRFCNRYGGAAGAVCRYADFDHGLYFLLPGRGSARRRGIIETAKAWRRFCVAPSGG
jgi:predicted O-methyltransferase YrrM